MKLITKPNLLKDTFLTLQSNYKQYYWTTAWAGVGSEPFDQLNLYSKRIKQIVVGLHFYQTHPDFIARFLSHEGVRFIKQPAGTFHPKLFLFYNSYDDWALLTGSNNFTLEAFSRNTEVAVLVESTDSGSGPILKQALSFIEDQWTAATTFGADELADYREMWKKQTRNIQSLSGQYGNKSKQSPRPAFQVAVMTMSWAEFIKKVRTEHAHPMVERLSVIELASSLFQKVNSFKDLNPDERKFIAGLPNNIPGGLDWGYFGSMKGFGVFAKEVGQNNDFISKALDEIPLSGQITKSHYDGFMQTFLQTFQNASKNIENPIASATRLLAMKRPDVFVCFDSKNRVQLCNHFGIKQADVTIESYWDIIVARIMDSEWWVNPKPANRQEQKVSEARAAFLDALYYEPKS